MCIRSGELYCFCRHCWAEIPMELMQLESMLSVPKFTPAVAQAKAAPPKILNPTLIDLALAT